MVDIRFFLQGPNVTCKLKLNVILRYNMPIAENLYYPSHVRIVDACHIPTCFIFIIKQSLVLSNFSENICTLLRFGKSILIFMLCSWSNSVNIVYVYNYKPIRTDKLHVHFKRFTYIFLLNNVVLGTCHSP